LTFTKCDLAEVEIAMFQELAWRFQLIIGFWYSTKCDLDEIKEALRTHFLSLDQPKIGFV